MLQHWNQHRVKAVDCTLRRLQEANRLTNVFNQNAFLNTEVQGTRVLVVWFWCEIVDGSRFWLNAAFQERQELTVQG